MACISIASAVVIFGPVARWWRLQRYAREAGVPTRAIDVPLAPVERASPTANLFAGPPDQWGDYFPSGPPGG